MRITERTTTTGRVDREAGMIHGVKLLGQESRNGRRYAPDAMAEAAPKYNGVKVFVGHPERDKLSEDRDWNDWAGIVENARFERGAIFGDIRLRKKSKHFEEILEAAEEFGHQFGMSHVADGEAKNYHGEEVIESISEVFSVDIVLQPATTAGLFESTIPDLDDGPNVAGVIPTVRAALVGCLKLPDAVRPSKESLTSLVDAIEQLEQAEQLKAGAAEIGLELKDHEIDRPDSPTLESYDCLGRPRLRETTDDDARHFANRLR